MISLDSTIGHAAMQLVSRLSLLYMYRIGVADLMNTSKTRWQLMCGLLRSDVRHPRCAFDAVELQGTDTYDTCNAVAAAFNKLDGVSGVGCVSGKPCVPWLFGFLAF